MKTLLSIQSHVVSGYVGNRAAVFPLQRMGYDVAAINTVQFSNHTGYGSWTGETVTAGHVRALVNGLRDRGLLHRYDAVLSGYLGEASVGDVILETVAEIRAHNPACVYCCDPVMGDVGRGLFVRPDIPDMFRVGMVPAATILTPNMFELELLTGITIQSLEEARAACKALHARGVPLVLVTSLMHASTPPGCIQMLASDVQGPAWLVTTPYLDFNPLPNGMGDLCAALFLGHRLAGCDIQTSLLRMATAMIDVLEIASREPGRELPLIAAQQAFSTVWELPAHPNIQLAAL